MKQGKKILHALGLSLICTAMLVFLAVNHTSVYLPKAKGKQVSQAKEKKPVEKTNQNSEPSELVLQDFSADVVVPMIHFQLDFACYLIFSVDFAFIQNPDFHFDQPRPLISYLAQTFEHHIAINAP
ncbi:MAG: hypothetical protein MUE85_04605 [Microscillaceae bacterium]|jgi:hypothetical protein|nr:hypothetical protein [Microscillaceae bacterium]